MIFNVIIAFIIPWVFGIILYFKDRKLLFIIAPFGSAVSYTINMWGFYMNYWNCKPFEHHIYSSLPFNIGIYPILGAYLVFFIRKRKYKTYFLISIFTILTTIFEWILLLSGRGRYSNGWNIYLTFITYLVAYLLAYWFYIQVKKIKVLD